MPTWWSKKPNNKNTKTQQQQQQHQTNGNSNTTLNFNKSPINKVKKNAEKPKSFDEVTGAAFLSRNSPRVSKDFTSYGGAVVDVDGGDKIGLPLPRPCVSSSFSNEQGLVFGSGSFSAGSSVSSSGSIDDHSISQINASRRQVDMKFNVRPKSPGPVSRGPTSPTSPLHSRLNALSLDSPTSRQEDGRSQCHPLPLPPGSPTSPSSLSNTRANGQLENNTSNRGKWKKGKLLGRGTFGHVYQGFHSETGQMCAIKEVRLVCDDQSSKECLKQLNQEINLLSQLSHPNIVQYYGSDLGEEALSVYLEFVSGGSIHKLLQEYGPFGEPVIQNYTRQIVSGLSYLHGRNTLHRDIKGANILVDPNGEIKLADFGMAKHINSSASMLSFKGSPYWMAPEVVMNTNGYSLPVDIWSLGCTILEMAMGKPPWNQYEGVAAIFKIGNSKDMPEIPEHLSNDAKNFIKLCLQRDPLARPTAQMLLDHPFIRDQSATKSVNVRITRDAFPYMLDGSRTPPVLEHNSNSNRTNNTLINGDYATKQVVASSRAVKSTRDSTRMITSLPVSPCSSPLRQYGPAHKSCFFSPHHPSYTMMGQNNLNSYPLRSNAAFTLEPWQEKSLYRAHTPPGGSPRTRLI
ncbi:PREDICTED: mitogen-activated protein kinase kinase kinase YODA-like isoform X2 [Lupinus angustifolius]|uniref:mitogen-activated protein kinase kinase kinase YODA-like isoform X1 n=1 Tax=Lupinus angustifolius TaxID=3871 RepID=UPI00092F5C62|nr:PREDICTED: mitogen-activated protein kinase kinase kinase YODA-like isoform X1 [Lupinus angustifolius]XP_019437218.1 PREDICTED: mitogen-activated protein kinase kinase kinase YODA-like isoform X2 [Lupinus angustifolius]